MSANDRKSLRPAASIKRSSIAGGVPMPKLKMPANDKNTRASIATSSPTKSTYAQKTQSSNSRAPTTSTEESNISVYVRCRTRNEREVNENSGVVVSTKNGREVVLQTGPMAVSNKTYTFDRVFGSVSEQEEVYEGMAKGVLQEMLQGYNCTIFAYGQTGTGKTYTMSGDIDMVGNRLSVNAGIIPRTLADLFKSLEKNTDFSVKISFIELYNEELRDLLRANELDERKVRIFEDPNKKTINVQGMEEIYIKTASEGMDVLAKGSHNRQVAATKCNDLSSRSHSVFTITVHMKEIDPISGEEFLKVGKLNLVDLAGSENISRSGAENKRAREAGMINQSLLTLGRVINALVDNSPHIPYRESKLTRLLQDSLGGKTKTCIIATVSPAKVSLEETISTLEYANRAKSIKNKPQVNQTMSKKMLIKEYVEEIERLRNDLNATRNKNGIYITQENLEKITAESESRRILVDEQKLKMNALEEQLRKLKIQFEDQLDKINEVEERMDVLKKENTSLSDQLAKAKESIYETQCELRIEKFVTKNHQDVAGEVSVVHTLLSNTLKEVLFARDELHAMLEKKQDLSGENKEVLTNSKSMISSQIGVISKDVLRLSQDNKVLGEDLNTNFQTMVEKQQSKIQKKCNDIDIFGGKIQRQIQDSINNIFEKSKEMTSGIDGIESVKREIIDSVISGLDQLKEITSSTTSAIISEVGTVGEKVTSLHESFDKEVQTTLQTVQKQLSAQTEEILSLSEKLLQHQLKHQEQLEMTAKRIELLKETEAETSKSEKESLLSKIADLLDAHEKERLKRIEEHSDEFAPVLRSMGDKQVAIAEKFKSFVGDGWSTNQQKFQERLLTQAEYIHQGIESGSKEVITNILPHMTSSLEQQKQTQSDSISRTVDDLTTKMFTIDNFAQNLKTLNEDTHHFTKAQLTGLGSHAQKSFHAITETFQKIGTALADTKPQLVDSYLEKQNQFVESYKDATLANVKNLDSFVSSIQYAEDGTPIPKRQKITVKAELPQPKPREEIIQIHKDEIYPPRSPVTEVATPTEKTFKQPLSEVVQNVNVTRESSEKVKTKSRSSSSASMRSVR